MPGRIFRKAILTVGLFLSGLLILSKGWWAFGKIYTHIFALAIYRNLHKPAFKSKTPLWGSSQAFTIKAKYKEVHLVYLQLSIFILLLLSGSYIDLDTFSGNFSMSVLQQQTVHNLFFVNTNNNLMRWIQPKGLEISKFFFSKHALSLAEIKACLVHNNLSLPNVLKSSFYTSRTNTESMLSSFYTSNSNAGYFDFT